MRAAWLLTVAALFSVSACSRPEAPHDVAFYRTHGAARAAAVRRCANAPSLAETPDCLAASDAAAAAESRRALVYQPPSSRLRDPSHL